MENAIAIRPMIYKEAREAAQIEKNISTTEDYHRMTEDFIMEVEKRCKWIAEEMRNFRHSDECKIGIAIVDAEALLAMLLKMEEEIESIN